MSLRPDLGPAPAAPDPTAVSRLVAALQRTADMLDGVAAGAAPAPGWDGPAGEAAAATSSRLGVTAREVAACLRLPVPALHRWREELETSPAGPAADVARGGVPAASVAALGARTAVEEAAAAASARALLLPQPRPSTTAGTAQAPASGWLAPVAGLHATAARALGDVPERLTDEVAAADDRDLLARLSAAAGRPATVAALVAALAPGRLERLAQQAPALVGGLDGVPWRTRVAANRVVLVAAHDAARRSGDHTRTAVLAGLLADPDRQFLLVDPAGDGRVVELHGDLDRADAVAVVVPGIRNTLATHDARLDPAARRLAAAAADSGAGSGPGSTAVVAWLGYDTPGVPDAPLAGTAGGAGSALAAFVAGLPRRPHGDRPRTTLIGHSYGSLVAASAVRSGAGADALVLLGSPGVGVRTAAELGLPRGAVFAARAPGDVVGWTEAFGRDPTDPRFGAVRLATGDAVGHAGYLDAGRTSLDGVAAVVTGRLDTVPTDGPGPLERQLAAVDEQDRRVADARTDALQRAADRALAPVAERLPPVAVAHELVDRAVDLSQRVGSVDLAADVAGDLRALARPDGPP